MCFELADSICEYPVEVDTFVVSCVTLILFVVGFQYRYHASVNPVQQIFIGCFIAVLPHHCPNLKSGSAPAHTVLSLDSNLPGACQFKIVIYCFLFIYSIDWIDCRVLLIVSHFVFWSLFTVSVMIWTPVHY